MSKKNQKDTAMTEKLLKKKITELTLDDIRALEKPLGTSARPFPMSGPQRTEQDGKSELEVGMSAIASDDQPLRVFSERSYEEVAALAYADMPVPSMLDLFMEALERRADPILRQKDILEGRTPQNENFNRTQMLLGDPGHGKSFMGALMGRLRSTGSVEVFDCGGKNMNDLLFEMVLDFGAGDALPTAIDKKLAAGALEPLSIGLLKGLPGASIVKGELVGIDWQKLKVGGKDDVEKAYEILKKVSAVEGLDKQGGNALGMNSQYGALVRAFLENREIVLDEYNKSREGSDNALQTVIQFLIGEIRECTVENPLKNKDNTSGPSSFTFRREDMGAGFFVTLTGNKTEDGITTRSLNRSVYDRLKPDTLPDPSPDDWQHRICQMMVGVPVSTLYMTFQEHADKDPEAFGEWLMWIRETKAKVEGTEVPDLQRTLLSNWQNVVSASDKLARFYHRWAEMTDAEKITFNGNAALIEEIDEEYSKKEAMSFRRIKQHLEEAIPMRPRMLPQDTPVAFEKGAWTKPPQLTERVEENPALHFGTRLVEYIENMVYKKSDAVGKPKLYAQLMQAMKEIGLRDIVLKEAAHSEQRSVETDLNISAFADRDLSKQAAMARKIFCDYIRQMDPRVVTATDEEIVTVKRFTDTLAEVSKKDTALTGEIFVANRDLKTLAAGTLLTNVSIRDTAVYALENRDSLDFTLDDLVPHDDFLAALALPTVGAKNLTAIWDTNIRKVSERGEGVDEAAAADPVPLSEDQDEAMRMAENRSKLGIATTTLYVLDENTQRPVPVHIITNTKRNKTLVVSQKVPSKLQAAFNEAGIVHVDVADANAKIRVEAAIRDITRGMPDSVVTTLTVGFNYRNVIDDEIVDDKDPNKGKPAPTKLSEIIFDSRLDAHYHKYLLRSPAKAAPKAA